MNSKYNYDIALSFAGEDRAYVEEVALLLQGYGVKVFYDRFEEDKLWGKNLYDYLSEVYRDHAKYTIMFISQHYKKKLWTNHERESMQERAFQSSSEYILPARFDDTEIPGIRKTTGYLDLKDKSPADFVNIILKKINWQFNKRWWGDWKVESYSSAYGAYLQIHKVTPDGFNFNVSTHHGAHTGEIEGTALFIDKNEATYKSGKTLDEICTLYFIKTNNVIQINQSLGCNRFAGQRAFFQGDYILKKDPFLKIDSINDLHLTTIYSLLGKDNWNYYVNCFSDIHYPDSLDGQNEKVIAGGVPGLYTICESILMIEGVNVRGAFLKDDQVYYFTNTQEIELPITIKHWKINFDTKKVNLLQ